MSIFSGNRALTLYAQLQPGGPRVIPNSTGTWTNAGVAQMRFDTFDPKSANPLNTPKYKTGNSSPMKGVRGRQGGSGSLSKPFIPSGAAGTAPDDDVILQSIFGAAPTTVASTSVTYALADAIKYLFVPFYNKNAGMSSPTNAYMLGATPTQATFKIGGDFLDYTVNFTAVGRGDSQNFSSYTGGDSILKGGLTTYPAEPTGLTLNGNVVPGFGSGSSAQFGGSSLAELRGSVEITINTGISSIPDGVNDAYITGFLRGLRTIGVSKIQCIDSDGTVLNTLKQNSFSKTPLNIALSVYGVVGSTSTFNLGNVQWDAFEWSENGDALDVSFPNAMAHQTSIAALDDFTMVLT